MVSDVETWANDGVARRILGILDVNRIDVIIARTQAGTLAWVIIVSD